MDADVPAEIVIVAPRLPEAAGEDAYSTFQIDPAVLENAIRLDDALRTAPGVALFRRNDSAAANPTIQGLSVRAIAPSGAGRALVTLDGQPLNDPFGGWVIWGQLPPETIGSATVLRGAGAGPYGAGALTGVVHLEERRGQSAALSLEAGEDGYARASALAEGGEDALSFMLAASVSESDGWVPVHEGRGAADTALWSDSAAGVARVQWRGDDLVFAARLGGYSEQRSAGLVGAESASDGASLSLTLAAPRGAFAWRVQTWALTSDLANSSVSVAPDRSATTPANDQLHTPAVGWGGNAAVRWTGEDRGLELGADLRTANGETQERFSFVGGAFTRSRVAGGKALTAGVYAETWRTVGPWLLSGGARVDVTRAEDGTRVERLLATGATTLAFAPEDSETIAPTARFGFRRALGEMFVRGAAYSGFRPPTLNELHRPFRVGNDVTEANAALEPERLYGADFGVGADYAAWSWDAGVFVNRLDDAIVNVTLDPSNVPPCPAFPTGGACRQRQNAGQIDAVGVEAEARGAVSEALRWRAAFAYTDAETDSGLRSDRFEDDLITRVLSAATTLDLRVQQQLSPLAAVYLALDNALDADVETAETADGVESFGPPQALRFGVRFSR
jgi:vitamin B12 transporter